MASFGEKDIEKARAKVNANLGDIRNKEKRNEVYQRRKEELKKLLSKEKKKRKREAEILGDQARPKQVARTLDNTREKDETMVEVDDEEVKGDESLDEYAQFFRGDKTPKICITSCLRPTKQMYDFIRNLLEVFPNAFYYARKKFTIKQIVDDAKETDFTDLIVVNEDHKEFNGLTLIHLPNGPTAFFRLSNVVLSKDIPGHGTIAPDAKPEVMLNNFNTRLGHRVGRMFGALFNQEPNFRGRRVVTFHNQRDFIFFRHHRYIFEGGGVVDDSKLEEEKEAEKKRKRIEKKNKYSHINNPAVEDSGVVTSSKMRAGEGEVKGVKVKASIQELGPRFTLKMQWMQHGTFDKQTGEYEWKHTTEMDTSRRRFFL